VPEKKRFIQLYGLIKQAIIHKPNIIAAFTDIDIAHKFSDI